MDWMLAPYLAPYMLSLLISISVALYAWLRREVRGAGAYSVIALGQASWTLGYIFELASPTLEGKIFWDDFQFIGGPVWFVGLLAFVLVFTGRRLQRPISSWILLTLFPLIFIILVYTDPWHGLVRPEASLIPGFPFDELTYPFTFVVWAWAIYSYTLFLIAFGLLMVSFVRERTMFTGQALAVVLGNLIPLVGTFLTMAGLTLSFHRDITPLTFAIGNIVVGGGLFGFRLFDVVPAARDVVVENMRDIVVVLDNDNRVVDINPAARRAMNIGEKNVVGWSIDKAAVEWPDLVQRFRGSDNLDTEIRVVLPSGERFFDFRIEPLLSRRHRLAGRVIVARDVTDRKQIEQDLRHHTVRLEETNKELERLNEQLQVLSRVKDEFISNVSHELRTPITNIKLHMHIVSSRSVTEQHKHLDILRRETDRLSSLVESLLLLSRLDQRQGEIDLQVVDVNTLIENYITDRQLLAEQRHLSLELRLTPELPPVQGDQNLIGQVVSILLTNAFAYTPSGGKVSVRTYLEMSEPVWVCLQVKDTGPGIAPEEQEHIFSRFYRGEAGRSSSESGTGLGLSIAKQIIVQHSGKITVESKGIPGEGTIFTIWLPKEGRQSYIP